MCGLLEEEELLVEAEGRLHTAGPEVWIGEEGVATAGGSACGRHQQPPDWLLLGVCHPSLGWKSPWP